MRFTVTDRRHRTDLEAHHIHASSTLADLLTAIGIRVPPEVAIDGGVASTDTPLDTIVDGAHIDLDRPGLPMLADQTVAELHALAGPIAGRVWRLAPGTYTVGSTPSDIYLPGSPDFVLRVDATGHVAIDGIEHEPAFRAGPHHLRLQRPASVPLAGVGARRFFNRPPRHRRREQPVEMRPPGREAIRGHGRRLSVIALLVPVLTGGFLALMFHRVLFLAFAVISPVMMLGNTWDDRRRRRRETAEVEAEFTAGLAAFDRKTTGYQARALLRSYEDHPSVAELVSRADRTAVDLWERRPAHEDFGRIVIGYGDVRSPLPIVGTGLLEPEVQDMLENREMLRHAPVTIVLGGGRTVGIVGERPTTRAAARSVLAQAAALHGPADLRVGVVTDDPVAWDWVKWLPHTCLNGGTELRMLAGSGAEIAHLLGFLRSAPVDGEPGPLTVLLVDHPGLDDEQRRVLDAVLAGSGRIVTGVVLVEQAARLPARCTAIVDLSGEPATAWEPGRADDVRRFVPTAISTNVADRLSRRLCHLDDPEAVHTGAGLPESIGLLDLLEITDPTAAAIRERWDAPPRIATPIGATEGGVLTVDLVADGPHGLLAGTTGSGKSEFLRSLVAGLAACVDPDHLTFVLVDYKGGAAFDACAELPHVVGLVTDLDEELSRRALTCLEAELVLRERRLREAGVAGIDQLWAAEGTQTPLPRLAVIVDEFATLAAELPDFMDALVDVAQRGRSLGVHMLLATQRPAGIVKDSIRANTNLRVSLRVQTATDSSDVLGAPDAARISRSHAGRGLVRLGPGELIPFQTALVSGQGGTAAGPLVVTPFAFGLQQPVSHLVDRPDAPGPSDLERLVGAIDAAHRASGRPDPRRPWPDPLPADLPATALRHDGPGAALGLVDLPDRQRQDVWTWNPLDDGNLLMAGMAAARVGRAAVAAAAGLAGTMSPDDLHVYAVDHGDGSLRDLARLPHVGAVVPAAALDRQIRLLETLLREFTHRRAGGRPAPTILLVLDGLAGFRTAFEDPDTIAYRDRLQELVAAGPAQRIFTLVTADQARAVPGALAGVLPNRLVFALADRLDATSLGLRASPGDLPPGRAVDARTGRLIQLVTDPNASLAAAAAWPVPTEPPDPIGTLGGEVALTEIVDAGSVNADRWDLPIGLDDRLLRPVTVPFYDGDHLLIAGPRRSGRSTALGVIAAALAKLDATITIAVLAGPRSPLQEDPNVDQVLESVDDLDGVSGPALLLVDDAEAVNDVGDRLTGLLSASGTGIRVVAAGRTDVLRSLPRHWTRGLRASRRGLILQPADTADGDVVSVRLPRGAPVTVPGRGYLVDGTSILVQVARP